MFALSFILKCICRDILYMFDGIYYMLITPDDTTKDPSTTIKILKFGTPQTIAIIVLKIEKFDVTLH